jgi:hypothetical protein
MAILGNRLKWWNFERDAVLHLGDRRAGDHDHHRVDWRLAQQCQHDVRWAEFIDWIGALSVIGTPTSEGHVSALVHSRRTSIGAEKFFSDEHYLVRW